MTLVQTDFETWHAHWDLDGRSLFLEYVRKVHAQTLTPSPKRAFELGLTQAGQQPLFTDSVRDAGRTPGGRLRRLPSLLTTLKKMMTQWLQFSRH
jgi:hypothetical protein